MRRSLERPGPARQRGWIGLVVLLIALVIVGMLAKTALKQYGLLDGASSAAPASHATPVGQAPQDTAAEPSTPRNAMERARGLEQSVQQQADDLNKRIDEASKVK